MFSSGSSVSGFMFRSLIYSNYFLYKVIVVFLPLLCPHNTAYFTDTHSTMLALVSRTTTRKWKQSRCLSTAELIIEYYKYTNCVMDNENMVHIH